MSALLYACELPVEVADMRGGGTERVDQQQTDRAQLGHRVIGVGVSIARSASSARRRSSKSA